MNHVSVSNVIDTINAMKKQEQSGYNTQNGIYHRTTRRSSVTAIDAECRRSVVSWFKQIANFLNLNHHTIAIAINTLDRFVAKEPQILSNDNAGYEFRLAAMASLYTSIKINEPAAIDPTGISKLSKGAFSPQDVEKMETRILSKLGWRVNPPTAMAFAEMYLQLLIPNNQATTVKKQIQCQLEHAMEDCRFLGYFASEIAFTATQNAFMLMLDYSPYLENLQNALDLNTLPFHLEKLLINHIENNESSPTLLYRATAPASKEQQTGRSSPKTTRHHL